MVQFVFMSCKMEGSLALSWHTGMRLKGQVPSQVPLDADAEVSCYMRQSTHGHITHLQGDKSDFECLPYDSDMLILGC